MPIDAKTNLLLPPTTGQARAKAKFSWTSDHGILRILGIVGIVFVFALPLINSGNYTIQLGTQALIYILLALGLNVVVGYAGLLDLGYVAFFAVGAYTSGILTTRLGWPMWATIPAVILMCVIAGIVIGGPTLRLRSDYLAIVTLGFGEIIRIVAQNWEPVTGGPSGIFGIPSWSFGGFTLNKIQLYYFCAVVVLLLGCFGIPRLAKGKLGRAWKAVRDDEDAAEAMGINTYTTKITAYIIGAVWAGLAGQLQASFISVVTPSSFVFLQSALVLMAVVIGGMGSVPGVILGAIIITLGPELLRDVWENRYLAFGILLLVVMLARPKGLWPSTSVLPWSRDKRDHDAKVETPAKSHDYDPQEEVPS
ncbi:MAG: branched-chain amino acid ABC transporter permease [Propionibacteriaceae bacterium]|jgi:branched-chain amino acid transport system permease protein|nr:branched-chain amino acid ABC transporter permease [Propionibacteriaceae bacterium]